MVRARSANGEACCGAACGLGSADLPPSELGATTMVRGFGGGGFAGARLTLPETFTSSVKLYAYAADAGCGGGATRSP